MTDIKQYGLGRVHIPDERDESYPMELALKKLPRSVPSSKFWWFPEKQMRNQLDTPQCVGYSWRHELVASPVNLYDAPEPELIYNGAREYDDWEGEDYDGSSVRGGVKFLQSRGLVKSYVWATTLDEMKVYVLTKGPVVVGTDWYLNMFTPVNKEGLVDLDGPFIGGHAYLCIGYSSKKKAFRFLNSWGREWGQNGRFWIEEDDFDVLLNNYGEACGALDYKIA